MASNYSAFISNFHSLESYLKDWMNATFSYLEKALDSCWQTFCSGPHPDEVPESAMGGKGGKVESSLAKSDMSGK